MKDASIIIERSDTEQLRVALREFKGRKYIDVRVFFLPEGTDEMKPTKKGVTLYTNEISRVSNALQTISLQ
jgi:hypothetical protein